MKALRKLDAAHEHFELVEAAEPRPRPGWAVLDVSYGGICGTDLHIMHNTFPSWPPVTIGHEFVGRVAAVGEGSGHWAQGDRVVCEPHSLACGTCHLCRRGHAELCPAKRSPGWGIDGGMAERVCVPTALLHRVPDQVDDLAAALCEPTAIVVTALERMPVDPGATVLVFGPGPIGLLAALLARACGAGRTVLVGRPSSRSRLELAERLGLEVWDGTRTDVAARAHESTDGRGADLAVESTGSPAAIASAIGSLRRRGRLCVLGVGDTEPIEVPWKTATQRALDVTFSMSSSWSSWDAALALMARGAVDPAPLATVFPLDRWRDAFAALADRSVTKALLDPRVRERS